jgi:hypothetical protein
MAAPTTRAGTSACAHRTRKRHEAGDGERHSVVELRPVRSREGECDDHDQCDESCDDAELWKNHLDLDSGFFSARGALVRRARCSQGLCHFVTSAAGTLAFIAGHRGKWHV